jgi:hypothetical protein
MSTTTTQRTISRPRKLLFSVILVLVFLIVVEALAQLTFRAIYDHSYRPKKLHYLTSASWILDRDTARVPDYLSSLVIHPYFGFAVDAAGGARAGFGFGQWASPLQSLQHEDKLRVLVLGGSVAVQLMQQDPAGRGSFLRNALADAIDRYGIDLDVWTFHGALPGFKQPQQYLAASFLLSQGAEFDLILNLDGFNEMTLAMMEGRTKGLHPSYPRGWDVMLGRRLTAGKLRKIARLLQVREDQTSLIEFAQSTPLARSALVGLFVARTVIANEQRAQVLVAEVEQKRQQGELSFEEGGIPFDYGEENKAYDYLAALWKRSSVLLSRLAKSNGAEYLHVFQPNQYLEGSKSLTEQEREKFYVPDIGFGPIYRDAYPYFRQRMDELVETGVWFADASMVFKDEKRTVYSDRCCHFNERGLRLLAGFIAEDVVVESRRLNPLKNKPAE